MRLHEIFTAEEWQRLEQLIYASTYKALATYQQQRATQQRLATKPAASFKPQAAKTVKSLARKAIRPPHAAPPRSLPTPKHVPQSKAEATPTYRFVKTVKPLPPTTRIAMAKSQLNPAQPVPIKPAPPSIMKHDEIDQAARRMLPKNKRGQNPTDLLSLDEWG